MLTVLVVSHTHWDREWYHPAERFRQRLVPLIDELVDDPPPPGTSFLLDGQTVVLEDYLDVRPERASGLAAALRGRRLEAGPWFVLPDELIPGGEGLVRNLLAGRRTLTALRADAPRVLYCPDSFGHPAALPDLAAGFDMRLIVAWRGFGAASNPRSDVLWWQSPGGARVLLYHLSASGYELGANLPADDSAARARWTRIHAELAPRAVTGAVLLLNGADHHARQHHLPAALDALARAARPDVIQPSRLADAAAEIERRAARRSLPTIQGELRDSYGFTWTLQGTLGSRTPQKRRYARAERLLVRDVEPWVAFAAFRGNSSRLALTRAAWRSVLLCQPHDTLCGCSVDQVARAMDVRLESAVSQGEGLREDALLDLIGHDRDTARARRADWTPVVLVRNRSPRARSGVASIEVMRKIADVGVGPGSRHVAIPRRATHDRTESPRAYPDDDAVERTTRDIWVDDVPAYGVLAIPVAQLERTPAPPAAGPPVTVKGRRMSNGRMSVVWDARGRVRLEYPAERRAVASLLDWESRRDAGDLYTPSIRGKRLTPRLVATKVVARGPLRASVEQRWRFTARDGRVDVTLRITLEAGMPFVRIELEGDNAARDHRLRLRLRDDLRGAGAATTVADAAFGPVLRQPSVAPAATARMERPVPTAPLHRYVSRFAATRGATLFSDGFPEYEATRDGFAVTVVRAVGELSRSDLPERPGHAGWPAPTPLAQCIGPIGGALAVMLHGPRSAATIDEIERAADDALYPLEGDTLRAALRVPAPVHGVALDGHGLSFSCAKESESGDALVLRCVNLLEVEAAGSWRLGRPIREAHLARLDETTVTPIVAHGDRVPFLAPPRGVVTIVVR